MQDLKENEKLKEIKEKLESVEDITEEIEADLKESAKQEKEIPKVEEVLKDDEQIEGPLEVVEDDNKKPFNMVAVVVGGVVLVVLGLFTIFMFKSDDNAVNEEQKGKQKQMIKWAF
jgi:hypothetical protein